MIINNDMAPTPKGSDVETVLRCPTLLDLASNSVKEEVIRRRPDLIQYAKKPSESLQLLAMVSGDDIFQYINHPTEKVRLYAAIIDGDTNVGSFDIRTVLGIFDILTDHTNCVDTTNVPEDMDMSDDGKRVCLNTIGYTISLLLKTKSFSKWGLLKVIWRMIFHKDKNSKAD